MFDLFFVFQTLAHISTFMILDNALTQFVNSPYYFIHAIHNGLIVYYTAPDVLATITDFKNITTYSPSSTAISLCFALHIYHILQYFKKLRFDDWLHHILMIGFALPVPLIYDAYTLIGFSLFFTTGLPGGIDYAMLFAVRNGWLNKMTEKRINAWMNVWIRAPGCTAQAVCTIMSIFSENIPYDSPGFYMRLMPALLVYWNGQYFMRQVVEDTQMQERLLLEE